MIFNSVRALRPKRNVFNLSYDKKFTCDMGQLIPILCEEVYPGDKFKISNEAVVRLQPLVAPVLQGINIKTEYFFCPSRLLWDDWSDFITGGKDGDQAPEIPLFGLGAGSSATSKTFAKYGLADYFGLPVGQAIAKDDLPVALPFRAYRKIWNEYYRDENVDNEIDETVDNDDSILYRRWNKDYFTSALPFQQRGTAPALPLAGAGPVEFGDVVSGLDFHSVSASKIFTKDDSILFGLDSSGVIPTKGAHFGVSVGNSGNYNSHNLQVDFGEAGTFDVADIRLAFQIQKFLERNARAGVRLPEFCLAHFGVSPSDSRMQRPEYLGGTKSPIIVSEVAQTSQTTADSPQGNLSGRGLGASAGFVGSPMFPEHGYVIGLMSIVPDLSYSSQGIAKMWSRRSKYDFYFPEFAHLSESAVLKQELCYRNNSSDKEIFGFQGIYDELRHNRSMVCSDMRDTFDYWHLARGFSNVPALNSSFLEMRPDKRIFAVQDEPGFIVDFANIITAIRPLPKYAEPGLIDHF